MVVILKHGRKYKAPTPPIYYSYTCYQCECKFAFTDRDTKYTYERTTSYGEPVFYIDCPECKTRSYEWSWQSETNEQ